MKTTPLSLYELNYLVRKTIELGMPRTYWVKAEIAELRENAGHCFIELIEKDPKYNTPTARASAKCWRQTWTAMKPYFEQTTGQRLAAGMKILVEVYAQFHEAYGFSWIVNNIDPTFTLGDIARRRMEIIQQLKKEGVIDLNRQLSMPLFTQRIAVVSSPTAAGYGDFIDQLHNNPYHYHFSTTLFHAVMQGESIEKSIIKALNDINERYEEFDCVVIIRGGGATSDMAGFDTLELAENVANFPLPVITGIGHERDECVLDIVSHTRVKTPTAAAALLVDNLHAVDNRIDEARQRLAALTTSILESEKKRLARITEGIPARYIALRTRHEARIAMLAGQLEKHTAITIANAARRVAHMEEKTAIAARHLLQTQQMRLQTLEKQADLLDPKRLLKRGYSITTIGGKALRDPKDAKEGDTIVTRLEKGTISSRIISLETHPTL